MRKIYLVFAILMATALAFTGCSAVNEPEGIEAGPSSERVEEASTTAAQPEESEDNWKIIEDVYIFAFPLVLVDATAANATNTVAPTDTKAPVNQMIHASKLADADTKSVVTPNVDTVYTQVFFDLSEDAMVYQKPAADRFFSIELLDAYTNSAAILGTGGDTQDEKTYLIAGPDFDGEVPDGMELVQLPTNNAWMIARIMVENSADLENVYAIQDAMELTPLAAYGRESDLPEGAYDESKDYVPIEHVFSMTPQEFFSRANELMVKNPPTEADQAMVEKMESISVGAGLLFDASILGEDAANRWTGMLNGLEGKLLESSSDFMVQTGIWEFFGEPIAEFGTEYDYRTLIAIGGLGANPVSVAIYPQATHDDDGQVLNGENTYILHFNEAPSVEEYGFWSLTAYGEDKFLIDNSLDRYPVNDRSDLKFNEDGSLDILMQADPPEDETIMNNWLPVKPEQFHLYLRVYLPDSNMLGGDWLAPSIALS